MTPRWEKLDCRSAVNSFLPTYTAVSCWDLANEAHCLESVGFSEAEGQERQISKRLMWKIVDLILTKLILEM